MTTAEARAALKRRLSIPPSVTTSDADIDGYVIDAIDRLAPTVYQEVSPAVSVTVVADSFGEGSFDSSAYDDVRKVEVLDQGSFVSPSGGIYTHGGSTTVRGLFNGSNTLRVYYLRAYTITTVPRYLNAAVYYFALSEFYSALIGDKRQSNVYMHNASSSIDDMRDLADYWEQRAFAALADKVKPNAR